MTQVQGARTAARSLSWRVHGLDLAGLSWGSPDGTPVLALHGWLDNSASFFRLGPLLEGCHVVAPDLTGHGRSARRSADATYQIWDDLPEIVGVLDALGWERFALLGHSRGAIISTLLASAFPERVSRLVLLDAVAPDSVPAGDFPEQLRRFLIDKPRLLDRPQRVFATLEEAVASRMRHGLDEPAARRLVERNLVPCAGGLTWSTDPRLQGASAVKLSDEQIRAVLAKLEMPALLLLAGSSTEGEWAWMEDFARDGLRDLRVERVDGGHHFHMEDAVHDIAATIKTFLTAPGEPART